MDKCIVPGTFDPITNGHLDVIKRVSKIFDEVIVAVAESEKKGVLFDLDQRKKLAIESCKKISNVKVKSFDCLLVDFAKKNQCNVLVKGLRGYVDFEYEFQMAALNYQLDNTLETFFVMSPPKYMYLSSSHVRELARLGGDITKLVPACVNEAFYLKNQ